MVTDHSTGLFSLNSMVDHKQVTGYPLDNMTHMGEMLIAHHRLHARDKKTVIWKSDIAEVYRLMPLHPHWQLKQINVLYSWAVKPRKGVKTNYQMKHWQQMGGWVNWAFNVFPLLRPCLNNFYHKISSAHNPTRRIWVNNSIHDNFAWAARHIEASSGVHILRSWHWEPGSTDIIVFCDTCPAGLGFWYPSLNLGFCAPTPGVLDLSLIFYFEALCVFCTLQDVALRAPHLKKVVIYTDNLNTVQIFNSLACLPDYNPILKRAVDIILSHNLNLRILHIPGDQNIVTDALS